MKIIRIASLQEAGKVAYDIICEALQQGARVFGLATGSSPIPLYEQLVASDVDFSQSVSINLDEYVGLSATHPQSYHHFMYQHLFKYKPFQQSYLPDGTNLDAAQETARYDAVLAEHPIDVQILGIGRNGHIGFNEPGTPFSSTTHQVALAPSTIEANQRFFKEGETVPAFAYTMGLASIMTAKKIILIACGSSKAEAIKGMVEGPITEALPASILQRHPDVTLLVDAAAASLLQ